MKYIKSFISIALINLFFQNLCFAQTDSLKRDKKLRLVPLPVIYYSPETKFGFGALANMAFKLGNPELTRTSNVQTYVIYTLNKQAEITSDFTLFTNEEKYILKGKLSYVYFPENYYGIGNDLPELNEELISYRRFLVEGRVLRKIQKIFFAGLNYRFSNIYDLSSVEGGLLQRSQPLGYKGSLVSGLGLVVLWDSRDNILNPQRGLYAEISNLNFQKIVGSNFDFSTILVDLRTYFALNSKKNMILALQGFGKFTLGDAPFKELSELGSANLMRGYYRGRYRANHYYAIQSELRVHVFWRIGVVAFGGIGDVSNSNNQFEWKQIKPNYGLGLRFQIDKKDRVNIRIDYGFGKGEIQNFYLNIAEAF